MTDHSADTKRSAEPPTLQERQGALKQQYREDPAAGFQTTAVYSVTGDTTDPSRVRIAVDGPSGAVFDVGAHHSVCGDGELPCSGDIFLAALAACQEITIRLVATALGLTLDHLAVRVEGDWDARGTLAVDREAPIGYTAIRISIDLRTDAPQDKVERLLKSAKRYCVVSSTLGDAPAVEFRAIVNGR
ncbi:MAG: OsmC family protein [Chloroflexia bacterium]|nr:OsmC family protein [Chloroflexia bacterium]